MSRETNRATYILVKWINNNSQEYDGMEHWIPKSKLIEENAELGDHVRIKWYRKVWTGILKDEENLTKEEIKIKTKVAQQKKKGDVEKGKFNDKNINLSTVKKKGKAAKKNNTAAKTRKLKSEPKQKVGKILCIGSLPMDDDIKSDKTVSNSNNYEPNISPSPSDERFLFSPRKTMLEKSPKTTTSITKCTQKSPTSTSTKKSPRSGEKSSTSTQTKKSPRSGEKSPTSTSIKKSPRSDRKSPISTPTKKSPRSDRKSPTSTSTKKLLKLDRKSPTSTSTKKSPRSDRKSPTSTSTKKSPRSDKKSPTSKSPRSSEKSPTSTRISHKSPSPNVTLLDKKSTDRTPYILTTPLYSVSPQTSPIGQDDLMYYKTSPISTTRRVLFDKNELQNETEQLQKEWSKKIKEVTGRKHWSLSGPKAPALLSRALVKALYTEEELSNGYIGTKVGKQLDSRRLSLVEETVLREFDISLILRETVWGECKSSLLHMLKYMKKKQKQKTKI